MTSTKGIDALTDHQAVRVLALVVDHHAPLPDPARLRELGTALSHAADDADLRPYHRPGTPPPATVISPEPPSPTWPPPAPTSPT